MRRHVDSRRPRLSAQRDRFDAELDQGHGADLVPQLERLLHDHPFDERLYRQLMLALYRAGRPRDALETYQRARKRFDTELGLQPGPELEELQRRILNQDPGLVPARRPPAVLPAGSRRRRWIALVAAAFVVAGAVTLAFVLTSSGSGSPVVVRDSLVKLDPDTGKVLDVVRVGHQPISVAVVGNDVWTGNVEDATLTRIDAKSGHTDTLGGIRAPYDVAAVGSHHLWFSTYGYEQVTRIDTRTRQVDAVVPLRERTFLLGLGDGSLWVVEHPSNLGDRGSVARIDLKTARLERTYRVQAFPIDVKVGLGAAWVTNGGDGSVSRINLEDGSVERVPIGIGPGSLAIAFGSLWIIAGGGQDTIWRLNPSTRQADAVINVGKYPFDIVSAAHAVWVTRREAGIVLRIDPRTNTVTKTIHLGFKPQGMTVGDDALWVTVGHGELGPLGGEEPDSTPAGGPAATVEARRAPTRQTRALCETCSALPAGPETWHYGVVARWWALFNTDGPEIAYFQRFIEGGGEPALDVACGTGRLLVPWLRAGLDVDGCDISADMLALCRERAKSEGFSPQLSVQPMHELQLPRRYRTIVVCGGFGLGSTRGQDFAALRRFHDLLEPGGLLLLDNEAPYNDSWEWKYWLADERAALPEPWQEPNERRAGPDGAEYALRTRMVDADPLEQSVTMEMRAWMWRDGELVAEDEHRLTLNLYFRNELELMLERTGFVDITVRGDYKDEPPTRDSAFLVFIARKPER